MSLRPGRVIEGCVYPVPRTRDVLDAGNVPDYAGCLPRIVRPHLDNGQPD
jgi:hypothetical protein